MFKQYRPIERGEFIVVGVDTASGGGDYTAAQFLSKTKLDVPLVYHSPITTTEFTNLLVPVLEKIYDKTGIKPVVAYERNNGGAFEMDRLAAMNRLNKYDLFKMPSFGRENPPEAVQYGWTTSSSTRPKMLQDLKQAIDNKVIRIYDKETINELYSFVVVQTSSSWKAQADKGAKDDLCFVAGTMVQTSKGQMPIEKLKPGDMVMTTEGFKPILVISKRKAKVIKRLGLVGTPNHPIITKRGVVPLDKVKASDIIYIWNEKLSSIEEKNITDIPNPKEDNCGFISGTIVIGKNHLLLYIGKFGLIILEKFQKVMLFIIKTIILLIIALIILNLYNLINICLFICGQKREENYQEKLGKNKQNELKKPLKNGEKTIKNWLIKFIKRVGKKTKKELLKHLKNGEKKIQNWQKKYQLRQENLKRKELNKPLLIGEKIIQNGEKKPKKILNIYFLKNPKQLFVYNVVKLLLILENKVLNFAVKVAGLDTKDRKISEQIVYNLLVDNPHNYFANNILVHNCMSLGISYQVSLFAKEPVTEKQAQVYYEHIEDLHKKLFDEQGFY